ncbi:SDR family oxidoreductase [soil metagenome]
MDAPATRRPLLLLTGATGYVGGRLLRVLQERGYRVRCLARQPEYLQPRLQPGSQAVQGDLLDEGSLASALQGVDTAYYLFHSMGSEGDFREEDRRAAENFARAARSAGVRRLVYLGGLGSETDLSPHLASRQEVGQLLRESGVPTVELRASIILGSGSLSFELVRALVERLPVMVTPRWVTRLAQPIAIEDVLEYLVAAVDAPTEESVVVEIGGPDRVSYRDLMAEYARQRGLRRVMLRVPFLTPRLSSLWLRLVTPVYAPVGRKLIDSVRHDTVVTSALAGELFPGIRPQGVREAIARALAKEERDFAETRWSDALSALRTPRSWGGARLGSRLVDSRTRAVAVPAAAAFAPIRRIGGKRGWYYGDWLWRLRGFLDTLVGGPGLRRGRRVPDELAPGDTVDFWRVEAFEPNRLLRLQAEMRVPGRAWLQFEVEGEGDRSIIRQTAVFDPVGLAGLAYWYALYPLHGFVFGGMLRGIALAADPAAEAAGA